jgi:hypothetical protein
MRNKEALLRSIFEARGAAGGSHDKAWRELAHLFMQILSGITY